MSLSMRHAHGLLDDCTGVRGTTITITVLYAMEFRDFYVHVILLTPLIFNENKKVAHRPFLCVM